VERFLYGIHVGRLGGKHQNSDVKRIGERLKFLLKINQFTAAAYSENYPNLVIIDIRIIDD
jgi:hypothetical protein